jgi:hypothetical protein
VASAPVEKEFIFDEKEFMLGNDHSNYSLDYEIFHSDIDTSEMSEEKLEKICKAIEKKTSQACFANFRNCYLDFFYKNKINANRLRFFCEPKKHGRPATHLNEKEIEKWVKLCQKNKVMPKNIGKNFIKNGIYDINFEDLSRSML